jgi:hypothetical protein
MVRKTISLLDRNGEYLDVLSAILGTSVSQVVSDILDYVRTEDKEPSIWDDWFDKYDIHKEAVSKARKKRKVVEEKEDITDILEDNKGEGLKIWKDKNEEED